jgi:hypothetical protein
LSSIGFPQHGPTVIYEDNSSAIKIAEKPKDVKRTRYIMVKYHVINERISNNVIKLVPINGKENPADMFTKPQSLLMLNYVMLIDLFCVDIMSMGGCYVMSLWCTDICIFISTFS